MPASKILSYLYIGSRQDAKDKKKLFHYPVSDTVSSFEISKFPSLHSLLNVIIPIVTLSHYIIPAQVVP